MPLFSFIFDVLREVAPAQLRQLARFLNSELPSARIRPRVAGLLNKLMYDHILVQPPFTTAPQAKHTWVRRGAPVLCHGQPLFPPVQPRDSDMRVPQLVWINVPELHSRTCHFCFALCVAYYVHRLHRCPGISSLKLALFFLRRIFQSTSDCCPIAAFCSAAVACSLSCRGLNVAILSRYRSQCRLNYAAAMCLLQFIGGSAPGRIEVATSLGYQGKTGEHVVLCMPVNKAHWTSFHLQPRALFSMLGRARECVYLFRHLGVFASTLPGRTELAGLLQWYEAGASCFPVVQS